MDPSILLSDEAFARRIAIALLRDRAAAEDLVQEAWLSILERPPKHGANPRGYLALILGRLALRRRRGEARRSSRERQRARGEAPPSSAEVVARAEIHQLTVAAVLKLEEPYRSTVLLHFFEDLGFEEIAARERIPVETVRTRHKRALAMLRARLEDEGRDWREEWAVALSGGRWPGSAASGATKRAALRLGLVGAVCMVPLLVWMARERVPDAGSAPPTAARETETAGSAVDLALAPTSGTERETLPEVPNEAPATSAPTFSGRCTDAAGNPLSGVRLSLTIDRFGRSPPIAVASTDDAGRFALSLEGWTSLSPVGRGLLGLIVDYWKPGYAPGEKSLELDSDGLPRELDLVLEPGRVLSMRTVDASGAGLETMRAILQVRSEDPARPPRSVAGLSGREGWIALGLQPGERPVDLLLWTSIHGYAYLGEAELSSETQGDIELGPILVQPGLEMSGRVTYPDGSPARYLALTTSLVEPAPGGGFRPLAEGPRSELANGVVRVLDGTDALGRFRIRGLRPGLYQLLREDATPEPLEGRAWVAGDERIETVFSGHRAMVTVLDPEGTPLEEARIAIAYWTNDGDLAREPALTMTFSKDGMGLNHAANETISFLAVAPGCGIVEQLVETSAVRYETPVTLELPREDRRATLVLQPRDGTASAWLVDLCAPISGLPLPGLQDFAPDAEGRVSGLPVGEYLVRLEPRLSPDEPARCAELGLPVVLDVGETSLPFAVLPAGRVRFVFGGTAPADAASSSHALPAGSSMNIDRLEGVGTGRWDWIGVNFARSRGAIEIRSLAPDAGDWMRRFFRLAPRPGQTLELIAPAGPLRVRLALDGRLQVIERSLASGETLEIPVPQEASPPR